MSLVRRRALLPGLDDDRPDRATADRHRHAEKRPELLLASLGEVLVARVGRRVFDGDRPHLLDDGSGETLARLELYLAHGARIEAVGRCEFEQPIVGVDEVDRADVRPQVARHDLDRPLEDVVQRP